MLRLLCRGHYEGINGEGMMGWRFEDMRQLGDVMETLFGYMNLLYELRYPFKQ